MSFLVGGGGSYEDAFHVRTRMWSSHMGPLPAPIPGGRGLSKPKAAVQKFFLFPREAACWKGSGKARYGCFSLKYSPLLAGGCGVTMDGSGQTNKLETASNFFHVSSFLGKFPCNFMEPSETFLYRKGVTGFLF